MCIRNVCICGHIQHHISDIVQFIIQIAGTTVKGAVDDLDLVIQTLEECGYSHDRFYIHCDGALFGLMMPFVKKVCEVCHFIHILYIFPIHKLLVFEYMSFTAAFYIIIQ